ncbi:MAG: bifunctional histidinol-phosphatase/imidazoleglycerol-phosphate dehydratase HisB [Ginsengibacter sp.]
MKKILFIDRDGTLITDPPPTYQVDEFPKLEFYPESIYYLGKISRELDYELVMITNQDGLGTEVFPDETFWPVQDFIMHTLANEKIHFKEVIIDRTFPSENNLTRKPGTALLKEYIDNPEYDLVNSFVIGDRVTDVLLAKNLGCKCFYINNNESLGAHEVNVSKKELAPFIAIETSAWEEIYNYLKLPPREAAVIRKTKETEINVKLNLDGTGISNIQTGLSFFNHMLEQISKHGNIDLEIICKGDLHIDEHHTIEDTGITLGKAILKALGDKRGIERYGFLLPMDDCLAQVAIDFGGRPWLIWDADFKREKIGDVPTEMFYHFFKSFSDGSLCNLNIQAEGDNEHHKIESIFKAFARAIKMAVKRDRENSSLPSTKGSL